MGRATQPMTHAVLAVAEARAGIEPARRGRRAARWLVTNRDLDKDRRPGWGLPYAWDAFGDGVGAAGDTNPAHHPYTITTAWALEALIAAHVAGWLPRSGRGSVTTLCTTVALRWLLEATTVHERAFFWYSPHPADSKFCPNVSSMMAGALQAGVAAGLVRDPGGTVRAAIDAAVESIVGVARYGEEFGPSWDYIVGADPPRPNDAVHHAYTIWGLERYRECGGSRLVPWQAEDAAASCTAHLSGTQATEWPVGTERTGMSSARLWGVGMCLAVVARWGTASCAAKFAKAAEAYLGPLGPRVRPDAPPSSVYPRHTVHLLLGLAELARRAQAGEIEPAVRFASTRRKDVRASD